MQYQKRVFCPKHGGPAANAIHHCVKMMRGTVLLSFMNSECGWQQRYKILVWEGAENSGCGLAKGKYNRDSTFGKVACFVS
jgi:hypothetical protein